MLAVAHGLDHLNAGISTIVSGSPRESFTTQLLQKTGMSDPWARSIDSGASMMLSMSAVATIQRAQAASYQSISPKLQEGYYNYLKRNPSELLIEAGEEATEGLQLAPKAHDIIYVTPQGVVIPPGLKYQIPSNFVENIKRMGSYGEYVNGKFIERLRIDPATLPGMKGPNYSHYHINGKSTHYSPRPGASDPGFSQ